MSDPVAVIREGIGAPKEHHRSCDTRKGQACDCYMRRYAPALAALDALVAERDEAVARGKNSWAHYEEARKSLLKAEEGRDLDRKILTGFREKAEAERDRLLEAASVAIGNLTVPGWIAPSAHVTHAVAVLRAALADVPAGDGE